MIGPGALTAEIAAKSVVLLGVRAGLAWLERQAGCAGLVVALDGGVHCSRDFAFDPASAS